VDPRRRLVGIWVSKRGPVVEHAEADDIGVVVVVVVVEHDGDAVVVVVVVGVVVDVVVDDGDVEVLVGLAVFELSLA